MGGISATHTHNDLLCPQNTERNQSGRAELSSLLPHDSSNKCHKDTFSEFKNILNEEKTKCAQLYNERKNYLTER